MGPKTRSTRQKKLGLCPSKLGNAKATNKMRMSELIFSFSYCLRSPGQCSEERKKNKRNRVGRNLNFSYSLININLCRKGSQIEN